MDIFHNNYKPPNAKLGEWFIRPMLSGVLVPGCAASCGEDLHFTRSHWFLLCFLTQISITMALLCLESSRQKAGNGWESRKGSGEACGGVICVCVSPGPGRDRGSKQTSTVFFRVFDSGTSVRWRRLNKSLHQIPGNPRNMCLKAFFVISWGCIYAYISKKKKCYCNTTWLFTDVWVSGNWCLCK